MSPLKWFTLIFSIFPAMAYRIYRVPPMATCIVHWYFYINFFLVRIKEKHKIFYRNNVRNKKIFFYGFYNFKFNGKLGSVSIRNFVNHLITTTRKTLCTTAAALVGCLWGGCGGKFEKLLWYGHKKTPVEIISGGLIILFSLT